MSASRDFEAVKSDGVVHCSVQNAAVSCVNHRERFTQYWASLSEERRKKKKKEKHLACFASSWFGTFAMFSRTAVSVVGH